MIGVDKRKLFLLLVVAAAVVLAGGLAIAQFGSSAPAQAASPQPAQPARCSLATLNGTYVFSHNGVQVTGSNKGPFAAAGGNVYDGRGHAHGFASSSLNGNISRHVSRTIIYTLNPDCTGTLTVTEATSAVTHYDVYTSPSGSRYTYLRTDPGAVASGVAEKR